MRRFLITIATVIAVGVAAIVAHLAVIEVGREVVTLRTPFANGDWHSTRLWLVDDGDASWLHSAGEAWQRRFAGDPVVELERDGEIRRYRARAVPGAHPRIDQLLREKYGLADRWVRFLAPCGENTVPVRLDPLHDGDGRRNVGGTKARLLDGSRALAAAMEHEGFALRGR